MHRARLTAVSCTAPIGTSSKWCGTKASNLCIIPTENGTVFSNEYRNVRANQSPSKAIPVNLFPSFTHTRLPKASQHIYL
jgi:hypothetical protein